RFGFRSGPSGALMRELKGLVVMYRHDEILVVIRERHTGKLADTVPSSRPNEDRPARIRLANQFERAVVDRVHDFRGRSIFRLIQELECEPVGDLGVVFGELRPDRFKTGNLRLRIGGEIIEMVNVDDDVKLLAEPSVNNRINSAEEFGLDAICGCWT